MKKLLLSLIILLFSACQNFDFEYYYYSPEERVYISAFEEEFGKVPTNHSWDYYSEYAYIDTPLTRAINTEIVDCPQSSFINDYEKLWTSRLPEGKNNSSIGESTFNFVSNGDFIINCVWYYSGNIRSTTNFEFGLLINDEQIKLFDDAGYDYYKNTPINAIKQGTNPKLAKLVNIGYGTEFKFYCRYNSRFMTSENQGRILFKKVEGDKEIIVLGFEDTPLNQSNCDKDFNDIVLYIVGNPKLPILETKRFFCEDLENNTSDFDFNDIVFDITPCGDSTDVTIKALGGTIPIKLYIGEYCIGNKDLHKLLHTGYKQSNVGEFLNIPEYTERIPLKINNLDNFQQVYAYAGKEYERRINFKPDSRAAVIIAVPVNTRWMKESHNIIYGYPKFFENGWWTECNDQYVVK